MLRKLDLGNCVGLLLFFIIIIVLLLGVFVMQG